MVAHNTSSALPLPLEDLIAELRSARPELVHYAGAAHRDPVALQVCLAYLADRTAPEYALKSRALAALGVVVSPEQIRAVSDATADVEWSQYVLADGRRVELSRARYTHPAAARDVELEDGQIARAIRADLIEQLAREPLLPASRLSQEERDQLADRAFRRADMIRGEG